MHPRPQFEPIPALSPAVRAAVEREALRVNDRYLHEVIEAYAFCPYARPGREAGQTRRLVHFADDPSLDPLVSRMVETVASGVSVTQVILPLLDISPADFTALCARLTALGHERLGGPPTLAFAPLHPELPFGDSAHALIPLFRRAPDPTIQWVRLDGLESIYAGRGGDDVYLPETEILAYLAAHASPRPSLYDRIASTNAAMARRLGVPHVVELLAAIARDARQSYARIILAEAG